MKIFYDTQTQTLVPYNRSDDEPVYGWLDPRYVVLDLTEQEKPEHNPATHYLNRTEAIDLNALQVTRGWELVAHELPPVIVTFRALAFALRAAGLYAQVKAIALSTEEGEIWWTTSQSSTVQRDHPFVITLGQALGLTPQQLDALFASAINLSPNL